MVAVARSEVSGITDDRVFPETRLLAVIIVPFLLVAWVILYLFPTHTKELFAWTINPTMTPIMLGSAYIGGAYFFTRAAMIPRWHLVTLGFPAVASFASLMGIATALHWDRFNRSHISFFAWVILYALTPFLVVGVWLRNRTTDAGAPDTHDAILPMPVRLGLGIVGVVNVAVSLLLFLQPQLMVGVWPWQITPLTARVLGGLFALPGVFEVGIGMAIDPRWSAARITLQSQIISLVFMLVGAARAWADFHHDNPLTWVFILGIGGLLLVLLALHIALDRYAASAR
jgi:hypothetical protein